MRIVIAIIFKSCILTFTPGISSGTIKPRPPLSSTGDVRRIPRPYVHPMSDPGLSANSAHVCVLLVDRSCGNPSHQSSRIFPFDGRRGHLREPRSANCSLSKLLYTYRFLYHSYRCRFLHQDIVLASTQIFDVYYHCTSNAHGRKNGTRYKGASSNVLHLLIARRPTQKFEAGLSPSSIYLELDETQSEFQATNSLKSSPKSPPG